MQLYRYIQSTNELLYIHSKWVLHHLFEQHQAGGSSWSATCNAHGYREYDNQNFPYFDKNPYSYTRVNYAIEVPRGRASTCCTLMLSTLIVPITHQTIWQSFLSCLSAKLTDSTMHGSWWDWHGGYWVCLCFRLHKVVHGSTRYHHIYIVSWRYCRKLGVQIHSTGYSFWYCYISTINSLAYFEC